MTGGLTNHEDFIRSTKLYDPKTERWRSAGNLPKALKNLRVTTINNTVLAFGTYTYISVSSTCQSNYRRFGQLQSCGHNLGVWYWGRDLEGGGTHDDGQKWTRCFRGQFFWLCCLVHLTNIVCVNIYASLSFFYHKYRNPPLYSLGLSWNIASLYVTLSNI